MSQPPNPVTADKMSVKSLFDIASATCIKNLKGLDSVGDLPYATVQHILFKIESAHQLHQIELNSSQILGQTGEIWLKLIEKDFPMEFKTRAFKPSTPDKWFRVWQKYKQHHDTALQESEDKLKMALAGLKQDKEKNVSRIIENNLVPRAVRMGGGKKMYSGARDTHSNVLSFAAGSRTKTLTGAGVMRKVRREVKEIANIHGALSRPIRGGPAGSSSSRPLKAPESMPNDCRRAAQPQHRLPARSPEASSIVAEYEERATFISDSDEPDDCGQPDGNDHDDDDNLLPKTPAHLIVKNQQPAAPHKRQFDLPRATPLSSPCTSLLAAPTTGTRSVPEKRRIKKGSGLLSNKFKGLKTKIQGKPKVQASSPPPSKLDDKTTSPQQQQQQQQGAEPKRYSNLSQAQPSPPVAASTSIGSLSAPQSQPQSHSQPKSQLQSPPPPPVTKSSASSNAVPRKRKAVDVFMRPRKRVV